MYTALLVILNIEVRSFQLWFCLAGEAPQMSARVRQRVALSVGAALVVISVPFEFVVAFQCHPTVPCALFLILNSNRYMGAM